jgi:hypothetical protein
MSEQDDLKCTSCGEGPLFLSPLHGEKGGPLMCVQCRLEWDQEDRKERKQKANLLEGFGFRVDRSVRDDDYCVLTLELLDEAIALTHPDRHPPERRAQAERVTAELLALRPFTLPKPEPEPEPVVREPPSPLLPPPDFPCETCFVTIPMYYCDACREIWEKREWEKDEQERAKQREWYAQRKARRGPTKKSSNGRKLRTFRQSTVAANQVPKSNLINHRLSGLQAAILRTALIKRVDGARGCDVSHAELLAEIWGWEPNYKLRWTEEDAGDNPDFCRPGDTIPSSCTYGAFSHIPRPALGAARASLSRAIARLDERMLISFVDGTRGTYSGGIVLTPHGEMIARLLPPIAKAAGK